MINHSGWSSHSVVDRVSNFARLNTEVEGSNVWDDGINKKGSQTQILKQSSHISSHWLSAASPLTVISCHASWPCAGSLSASRWGRWRSMRPLPGAWCSNSPLASCLSGADPWCFSATFPCHCSVRLLFRARLDTARAWPRCSCFGGGRSCCWPLPAQCTLSDSFNSLRYCRPDTGGSSNCQSWRNHFGCCAPADRQPCC